MPYYIPDLVSKTTCIGNTLSTFNTSFSNLDTRLYQLSTYTVNSVNFLSSTMISVSSVLNNRINFLSSAMISVSSDLRTQISSTSGSLQSQINYVSSNVVNDYILQGVLPSPNEGDVINWNFSTVGNNAYVILTATASLANPTNVLSGQTGNLIISLSDTGGVFLSSFGDKWKFYGNLSGLDSTAYSKNIISYYYDGSQFLSNIVSFTL